MKLLCRGREATQADISAIEILYPIANKRMLSQIQRGSVPKEYFRMLSEALQNAIVCGNSILTHIGQINNPDMIGEVALAAGCDVKKTDTLGMAQRGGSVISNVRIGQKVGSPLIRDGGADILVAFEKLEAARWVDYLRPGAVAIVNNHALPPLSVNLGNERYPGDEEIAGILRQRADRIYFINGTEAAKKLNEAKTWLAICRIPRP